VTLNLQVPSYAHSTDLSTNPHPSNLQLVTGPSYSTGTENYTLDISTARVIVTVNNLGSGCNGADFFGNIGCQIGAFFQSIWQIIGIGVGAVIFVFSVLFWFVGLIGVLFSSVLTLFTGPSGSTMPPQVAGILGILLLALVMFLALYFFGKVRGTGNTG
jgi:hypothetical protein